MRLLLAGPAHPGLAAALDALHGGAEGPIEWLGAHGGCQPGARRWWWFHADVWMSLAGIALSDGMAEADLLLTTPGDTSGAAAMAREAGVEVREVGL